MGYGNGEQIVKKSRLCKHCRWQIHEEPYKEFTVWCDYQSDGIFCGRRDKGLPHEPEEVVVNESLD
jgi:hypothetical protein